MIHATDFYQGILKQNVSMLGRAITLVESDLPEKQVLARELLHLIMTSKELCLRAPSIRLGISGIPGGGKSTFIESFGMALIEEGKSVAVLAIDPSSNLSGGSILGDKTRMRKLSAHDKAFVRPSPTQGSLGGVAPRTREAIILCEAFGFDYILVETVGVGQSEVIVSEMVDLFLLLVIPAAGDELQGIKRGILEMTDILIINKADGILKDRAAAIKLEYIRALSILARKKHWEESTFTCSALYSMGMKEIISYIEVLKQKLTASSDDFHRKRRDQLLVWLWKASEEKILCDLKESKEMKKILHQTKERVLSGEELPYVAAEKVVNAFYEVMSSSAYQTLRSKND
ncbi:MAG: methylmalonyl Co-A mutase-associated GTPase MeaB [Oligoflexia bacterium]|nr:methylmalonyl Co-A mutase-associated GTPase MeaB [Oligoflexia bacterium]MBF0366362.1 methylmalonyl Co-A mutase-associated GTPase MeaB [Oligoflexia bacterium]